MWIPRDFESSSIAAGVLPIKVLNGLRHVSKTSVLEQIGTHHVVYLVDAAIRSRAIESLRLFLDALPTFAEMPWADPSFGRSSTSGGSKWIGGRGGVDDRGGRVARAIRIQSAEMRDTGPFTSCLVPSANPSFACAGHRQVSTPAAIVMHFFHVTDVNVVHVIMVMLVALLVLRDVGSSVRSGGAADCRSTES
jgi:hypothetical protein